MRELIGYILLAPLFVISFAIVLLIITYIVSILSTLEVLLIVFVVVMPLLGSFLIGTCHKEDK